MGRIAAVGGYCQSPGNIFGQDRKQNKAQIVCDYVVHVTILNIDVEFLEKLIYNGHILVGCLFVKNGESDGGAEGLEEEAFSKVGSIVSRYSELVRRQDLTATTKISRCHDKNMN